VIQALDTVQVALMDGVHAQETGTTLWAGFAPLADGDFHRAGFVHGAAHTLIAR
jgi:hypothetical protein